MYICSGDPLVLVAIPLTMLARIYFGCHWFTDTVGGAAIGAGAAYAALPLSEAMLGS